MTGGQVAAFLLAILLLLPGGCFLLFGISWTADSLGNGSVGPIMLVIAAIILFLAGLLFRTALRRRPPPIADAGPGQDGREGDLG